MQIITQGPSEEEEDEREAEKREDNEVCTTPAQDLLYCSSSVDDGSEGNCITPLPLPHLDSSHCVSSVCICFVFIILYLFFCVAVCTCFFIILVVFTLFCFHLFIVIAFFLFFISSE